jgi:hypothetical protein
MLEPRAVVATLFLFSSYSPPHTYLTATPHHVSDHNACMNTSRLAPISRIVTDAPLEMPYNEDVTKILPLLRTK